MRIEFLLIILGVAICAGLYSILGALGLTIAPRWQFLFFFSSTLLLVIALMLDFLKDRKRKKELHRNITNA